MGHSTRPADDLKIEIYRVMPMSADSTKPMENEAIVATNLTKWFGEGEARMTAVNDVALVAHFGEMLFIIGPSGSGKTTMLSTPGRKSRSRGR
jgi:ABC-type glutathione transport system ATPase component